MKSVFGPNDEWLPEADKIERACSKALREVFEKFPDARPRELDYIARAASASEHLRILASGKRRK